MSTDLIKAIGVDLGGSKIEAQIFGDDWSLVDRLRVDTPTDYQSLVDSTAALIQQATAQAGRQVPVGIGAAGTISPVSGRILTANLPASNRPLPADLEAQLGHSVTYINDCRAFALSEARFGVAHNLSPVVALILGTGVGGAVVVNGSLIDGPGHIGGEFGHMPAPAYLVEQHDLPVLDCGCGQRGCIETLISGPGLEQLTLHLTGHRLSAPTIASTRQQDARAGLGWSLWRTLVADLMLSLCKVVDPRAFILGGGLSNVNGLAEELTTSLAKIIWSDYPIPQILIAQGGDASGARGAAWAAWQKSQ